MSMPAELVRKTSSEANIIWFNNFHSSACLLVCVPAADSPMPALRQIETVELIIKNIKRAGWWTRWGDEGRKYENKLKCVYELFWISINHSTYTQAKHKYERKEKKWIHWSGVYAKVNSFFMFIHKLFFFLSFCLAILSACWVSSRIPFRSVLFPLIHHCSSWVWSGGWNQVLTWLGWGLTLTIPFVLFAFQLSTGALDVLFECPSSHTLCDIRVGGRDWRRVGWRWMNLLNSSAECDEIHKFQSFGKKARGKTHFRLSD